MELIADSRSETERWPYRIHAGRRWVVICTMALIIVSDTPLRRRSEGAVTTRSGAIDAAVLLELSVYAVVALWLVLRVARPVRSTRLPPLLAAMWVFGVAMVIAALYSPAQPLALIRVGQLLTVLALSTTLYRRAPVGSFHRIATGFGLSIITLIGLGLIVHFPVTGDANRFSWLYTHPVTAGSLLAVAALMLLEPRIHSPILATRPRLRTFLAAVAIVALIANGTRGSAAALLLGAAVFAWFRWAQDPNQRVRGARVAIIALGIVPLLFVGQDVVAGFISRGQSSEQVLDANSRVDHWGEVWSVVQEKPITGAGYFSSRQIFQDEATGLGAAHNAHIEVLVNGGLLGFVPWVVLLCLAFAMAYRLARNHPDGPVLMGVLCVILVNSMTHHAIAQGGTGAAVIFFVVVAWLARAEAETWRPAEVRQPA